MEQLVQRKICISLMHSLLNNNSKWELGDIAIASFISNAQD